MKLAKKRLGDKRCNSRVHVLLRKYEKEKGGVTKVQKENMSTKGLMEYRSNMTVQPWDSGPRIKPSTRSRERKSRGRERLEEGP